MVVVGDPSERVFVGSSDACALVARDLTVSRRHLALQAVGPLLRVTDLGSKNGTTIAGVRIESALLAGGETVRIGETDVAIERIDAEPAQRVRRDAFGKVLGTSPAMQQIYPLLDKLAASSVPVLIEGETGTGKEQLAEALHEQGPRAARPFVVFDCTAVPPSLIEAELFGYERGAFTGAVTARPGVLELAHGGTLFVDEIADLDLALQPKLLRAIERLETRRLGASKSTRADVRLLFATRRDLEREVQAGRFRDDLFHRIVVARVELPPLRTREGDVALLARAFATTLGFDPASIPHEVLARWELSSWPGNVRELRNAVARYLELGALETTRTARGASLGALSEMAEKYVAEGVPLAIARERVIDELEKQYVARLLEIHNGDITSAATASGVARRQFFRLKAKLGRS